MSEYDEMLSKARDLIRRHEWVGALAVLDEATCLMPEGSDAWYQKGKILNRLERIEEALDAFDKMVAIDPQDADAWYHKGVALMKLGRTQLALEVFHEARRLSDVDSGPGEGIDFMAILDRGSDALEALDGLAQQEAGQASETVYTSDRFQYRFDLDFEWDDGTKETLQVDTASPWRVAISSRRYPECTVIVEATERVRCDYPAKELASDLGAGVAPESGGSRFYVFPNGLLPSYAVQLGEEDGPQTLIDVIVSDRFAYQLTIVLDPDADSSRFFARRAPLHLRPY